ncbi:hypothetical protein ACHQM5_003032 [Ranunculus cassubicifolius]
MNRGLAKESVLKYSSKLFWNAELRSFNGASSKMLLLRSVRPCSVLTLLWSASDWVQLRLVALLRGDAASLKVMVVGEGEFAGDDGVEWRSCVIGEAIDEVAGSVSLVGVLCFCHGRVARSAPPPATQWG